MKKINWTTNELILAFDLYLTEPIGPNKPRKELYNLSQLIRNKIYKGYPQLKNKSFRSEASVGLKLANFASLDPIIKGTMRSDEGVKFIWEHYGNNTDRLKKTADMLKIALSLGYNQDTESIANKNEYSASEGSILLRIHKQRERNSAIVKKKKKEFSQKHGKLFCEVCYFNYYNVYGDLGKDFIECHHTVQISDMKPNHKTRLDDLVLLCANCHRMIHSKNRKFKRMLTISELKDILMENT